VFLAQVVLLRLAGCRIVWAVHNLVNHDRRLAKVDWFFSLLFAGWRTSSSCMARSLDAR